MDKLDIICGNGKHRSWTTCLAECILLNIYGQLPDYFWHSDKFKKKYVSLIKISAKFGKKFGIDKLAEFIYKDDGSVFEKDIGLIVHKLTNFKSYGQFTIQNLVEIYKNKFRPQINKVIDCSNPEIKVIIKPSQNDIIGDL